MQGLELRVRPLLLEQHRTDLRYHLQEGPGLARLVQHRLQERQTGQLCQPGLLELA